MAAEKIWPVVLSGGAGTRLWPLSRELYPKQFLNLFGDTSLLQATIARVADGARFHPPLMVCNAEHRFVVAEQLRMGGVRPSAILLEPVARNTAPAIAAAATFVAARDNDGLMLVLPADHLIADIGAFQRAVLQAIPAARAGRIVTFGIKPERPETGFGYIKLGRPLDGAPGAFHVAHFTEKPDLPTATRFIADGNHFWNGGIFLFSATAMIGELARLQPALLDNARRALTGAAADLDFLRLEAAAFSACPPLSIDYAVMEKTALAATVPVDMGWNDVGSWTALWQIGKRDGQGNVTVGEVELQGATDCYVRSENGAVVALIGGHELVVVATDDAVLVAERGRVHEVKAVVERLKAAGRPQATSQRRHFRPWGHYQTLDGGDRFQVKHIVVQPGRSLSLQKHAKRAEHWVVVRGSAKVTRGGDQFLLDENQSTFIPIGAMHRLENPGPGPLHLIEVQSGAYLGEDDIVRVDDAYGRG